MYAGFLRPQGPRDDHYCPRCVDVRWHGPGRCFVCNKRGVKGWPLAKATTTRHDHYETHYAPAPCEQEEMRP